MARWRQKNRGRKARLVFFASVLVIFLLVWLFLSYSVNPILRKVSEEKVKELTTTAVNAATSSVIATSASNYVDLLEITKNSSGEIELIRVNTLLLNIMARSIVTESQTKISSMGEQGIAIPLGTLSGMTFLAGRGPDVRIKVFPVGAVSATFNSEFEEAGINQTRHKITLSINTGVSIIMPGMDKNVSIITDVALCENIIVGKVPEVYLKSSNTQDMLDLIP